jgi:hypothetical protein
MKTDLYITEDIISILKDTVTDSPVCDPRHLEELESENRKLRKVIAQQSLDIRMLREMTLANW